MWFRFCFVQLACGQILYKNEVHLLLPLGRQLLIVKQLYPPSQLGAFVPLVQGADTAALTHLTLRPKPSLKDMKCTTLCLPPYGLVSDVRRINYNNVLEGKSNVWA